MHCQLKRNQSKELLELKCSVYNVSFMIPNKIIECLSMSHKTHALILQWYIYSALLMPQNVKLSLMFHFLAVHKNVLQETHDQNSYICTPTIKTFAFLNKLVNFLCVNWIAFTGIIHILDERKLWRRLVWSIF